LLGQRLLEQHDDEYPILKLNPASWEVLRGQCAVRLSRLARRVRTERTRAPAAPSKDADPALFSVLRQLRRQIAAEIGKPPYIVFNDNTLREMARVRPATRAQLLQITGVGEFKLKAFGERFLDAIRSAGSA
jgi:ATP-dependent DNA helicase RecQ